MLKFKPQVYYWILFLGFFTYFSKYIFTQAYYGNNFIFAFIGFFLLIIWIVIAATIIYTIGLIPILFIYWALFESNTVSPKIIYTRYKSCTPYLNFIWNNRK